MLELFTVGILIIRNGTRHLNPLTSLNFFPNSSYSLLHEFSDQNSCWLLNYRLKRMHLSTSLGMATTAFFSGCKHVLIIKLMMPTASYKLEDSNPSKNPTKVNYRFYHLSVGFFGSADFQEFLPPKKLNFCANKNRFSKHVIYD